VTGPDSAFRLIEALQQEGIEFILVGGMAAVIHGAPIVTADLDVVHRRTEENVGRILALLTRLNAVHRFDLAGRKLSPTREQLLGHGHLNLVTDLGPLDLLCELAGDHGYEDLIGDTVQLAVGTDSIPVLSLARLIQVKSETGRAKDRMVLPVLIATLEKSKRGG